MGPYLRAGKISPHEAGDFQSTFVAAGEGDIREDSGQEKPQESPGRATLAPRRCRGEEVGHTGPDCSSLTGESGERGPWRQVRGQPRRADAAHCFPGCKSRGDPSSLGEKGKGAGLRGEKGVGVPPRDAAT